MRHKIPTNEHQLPWSPLVLFLWCNVGWMNDCSKSVSNTIHVCLSNVRRLPSTQEGKRSLRVVIGPFSLATVCFQEGEPNQTVSSKSQLPPWGQSATFKFKRCSNHERALRPLERRGQHSSTLFRRSGVTDLNGLISHGS